MLLGLIELGGGRQGGFRILVAGFGLGGKSRYYELMHSGEGAGTMIRFCKIQYFLM